VICPTCKTETRNRTKKGALRYYKCKPCGKTFRTREVVINQEEEVVTAYEKIREYLITRKTPPTITELSKHFLIGRTTVGRALRRLEAEGFARRILNGADQRWAATQETRPERPIKPVAIPQNVQPVRTTLQSPHIRTSYPNVRGYDD
jgi:hypothetical protein